MVRRKASGFSREARSNPRGIGTTIATPFTQIDPWGVKPAVLIWFDRVQSEWIRGCQARKSNLDHLHTRQRPRPKHHLIPGSTGNIEFGKLNVFKSHFV